MCLEKMAAKVGDYSPVADELDAWVPRIECLCSVYFQHYFLMLPHCHPGVVVSQTAHQSGPYWLSLADIRSSTSYVNTKTVVSKVSIQLLISNAAEYS